MFNFEPLKKQMASVLRKEMAETMKRYDRACKITFEFINKDGKVSPIDKDQEKIDKGRELWELIYGPYYKDLQNALKQINAMKETGQEADPGVRRYPYDPLP